MSEEAERWVLDCYAAGIESMAATLVETCGISPERAREVAGAVLARWSHLDPPLTVDLLQ